MHVSIEDSYRLRSCDMATPSPWPAESVFVKRYWRLPKTDPNSVLIEEVLLDHPSHCLPLGFWPAWKYDPYFLMWDLWIGKHSRELLVQKRTKTVQTTHRKAKWCKCRLCNKICDHSCTFGVDLVATPENFLSKLCQIVNEKEPLALTEY